MTETLPDMLDADATGVIAAQSGADPSTAITAGRIAWPVLLSLLVMVAIGYFTYEPGSFEDVLVRLNPWMLAAALGTLAARVFFGGWRITYISRGRLTLMAGLRGQLAWDFFSNITPSAIGGAPFAAVYIARDHGIRMGEATALMLFSMLLDQFFFALTIPVVLITSGFMEVIPRSLGTAGAVAIILYFVGMLVWVVLFGYATMFRPDVLQRLADRLFRLRWLRRFRQRVDQEMSQLRRRAIVLRSQPARFYIDGMLLTFGTWMSRYLLLLFIVWSLVDDFDQVLLLLRTAALTLGSLILPTPGGAGGIEGLYALFIGPMIPKAALAPSLLLWRVLGYYLFIGLGIFLTTHTVQKNLRRRAEAKEETAVEGARESERVQG